MRCMDTTRMDTFIGRWRRKPFTCIVARSLYRIKTTGTGLPPCGRMERTVTAWPYGLWENGFWGVPLLVLISDGLPNSNQYRGAKAVADLKDIKKELSRKGVLFLAGAIGSDKERIREIYQEAFLDLSDLEKLPVLLMKQVLKYIRRD